MQSYLLAIVAAEYVLGLVPRGTHTWDKFITPEHIKHVLAASVFLFVYLCFFFRL